MGLVCGEREDIYRELGRNHGMLLGIGNGLYFMRVLMEEIDFNCI